MAIKSLLLGNVIIKFVVALLLGLIQSRSRFVPLVPSVHVCLLVFILLFLVSIDLHQRLVA